jgi:hypothetical protein
MNTQEIFEKIEELFGEFKTEHSKTTKKAHNNARKALGEIKKLVSDYRKASILEDKTK